MSDVDRIEWITEFEETVLARDPSDLKRAGEVVTRGDVDYRIAYVHTDRPGPYRQRIGYRWIGYRWIGA